MLKLESITSILTARDGISRAEASTIIAEAQAALMGYIEADNLDGAYNVCEEYFGLEPDYLNELLPGFMF